MKMVPMALNCVVCLCLFVACISAAVLAPKTNQSIFTRLKGDILLEVLKYLVDPHDVVLCLNKAISENYKEVCKKRFFKGKCFDLPEISDFKADHPEVQRILRLRRLDDPKLVIAILNYEVFQRKSFKDLNIPLSFSLLRLNQDVNNCAKFISYELKDEGAFNPNIPYSVLIHLKNRAHFAKIFAMPHLLKFYFNEALNGNANDSKFWAMKCILYQGPLEVYEQFITDEVIIFILRDYDYIPPSDYTYLFETLNYIVDKYYSVGNPISHKYHKLVIKIRFGPDADLALDDDEINDIPLDFYMILAAKSNKLGLIWRFLSDPKLNMFERLVSAVKTMDVENFRLILVCFANFFTEEQKLRFLNIPVFIAILIRSFSFTNIQRQDDSVMITFITPEDLISRGFPQTSIEVTVNVGQLGISWIEDTVTIMIMRLNYEKAELSKFESFLSICLELIQSLNILRINIKADNHIFKLFLESERLRLMVERQNVLKFSFRNVGQLFSQSLKCLRGIVGDVHDHIFSLQQLTTDEEFKNYEEFFDQNIGEMILNSHAQSFQYWSAEEYVKLHRALEYWIKGPNRESILRLNSDYFLRNLRLEIPMEWRR